MRVPQIIAHRGASGHEYENSPASFRRAAALGADGIELDVHATADGVIVVHHDPCLPGRGPIAGLPSTDVLAYLLPNGERLPRLADALAIIGLRDVWIEVKSLSPQFDAGLLGVLDDGPAPARYAIHSFDHRILRRVGERRPSLPRGALVASYLLEPVALLEALGASVLWQEHPLIDEELVHRLHSAGKRIIGWTVNQPADTRRLSALGVDGLCGNYPDRLRRTLWPA